MTTSREVMTGKQEKSNTAHSIIIIKKKRIVSSPRHSSGLLGSGSHVQFFAIFLPALSMYK
jgi:hypothetical protein